MTDLAEDCEKYANTYVEAGATEACEKIVDFTKQAIAVFYGSYSPKIYDREGNIRDNSYEPILEISGESGKGGVRLSPDNMHEYWHHGKKGTTENIYTWVMHGGFHGSAATSTPPLVMITMAFKRFEPTIGKFAENAAKKQSYKVLRF